MKNIAIGTDRGLSETPRGDVRIFATPCGFAALAQP